MKLALAPVPYYWSRERLAGFYDGIGRAPVDVVYLGEQVCSRRHGMRVEDWMAIGEALAARGKEVVLSSQVLVQSEGDLKIVRRVLGNGRFRVEANDMGAVRLLAEHGGWVAGPHLNVYNPRTLELLAELGATRWVPPVEISREALAGILAQLPQGMETEVFGYGRLPLAFSARCFTARRYNLQKEACEFRCGEFPDGIALKSGDGAPFLVLNGIQTQSARVYCLVEALPALRELGVHVLRASAHAEHMPQVLELLRAACDGAIAPRDAARELHVLMPEAPCDGFFHGRPGLEAVAMRVTT